MLVLDLLGTLSLRDETHPVPVAAQQKRPLGLLAILGLAGRQGLARDRIEAYLWPESSGARAQHALDQTVYAIRHALGRDVILATARELRLNPELVRVDVWEFEQAIRAGQWTAAVGHYKGPLLDGVHFSDSHELEMEPDAEIEDLAAALSRPAITATVDLAVSPHTPSVTPSVATSTPQGKEHSRRDRTVLYAVIVLAILISGGAIWGWMRPAPAKQVVRSTLAMDSTEAMAPGAPWSGRVAISPDGSRLAYIGGPRSQLLIRARNQLHAIAVPGTEGASTPFFSPDGSQVGFLRVKDVQIASINGAPPITVTDTLLAGTAGASWGPDGFIYVDANTNGGGLLRVEAKPGAKPSWFTVLDTASGEFDHTWPDVLPNGKGVLFTVLFNRRNGVERRTSYSIAVADVPSGKHRVIVDDAMYARYASSGHLLYVTANKTLMVVPFDQNSMKVVGEPTALTEGMRLGLWGSADLAVSATGTLVYATGAGQGKQELVWVTRDGRAQAVDPDWTGDYLGFPALSPDGKWLAVGRVANAEPINIWIKRLDRGPSIKLTLDGNDNFGPAWTPDGRSVTFSSALLATGATDLWTERADGGAPAVMQLHEKRNLYNCGLVSRWQMADLP